MHQPHHTSVWSRFRSELASICVSEAEAFTYERERSSAPFLLVCHAIGFARALKTKHRIGCRGALTVTTLSRFRSRESAWGAVRLGTFAVLGRVWRRVTFAVLMARVCAKVLSQVCYRFRSFKPKTGSLSRTRPPGQKLASRTCNLDRPHSGGITISGSGAGAKF